MFYCSPEVYATERGRWRRAVHANVHRTDRRRSTPFSVPQAFVHTPQHGHVALHREIRMHHRKNVIGQGVQQRGRWHIDWIYAKIYPWEQQQNDVVYEYYFDIMKPGPTSLLQHCPTSLLQHCETRPTYHYFNIVKPGPKSTRSKNHYFNVFFVNQVHVDLVSHHRTSLFYFMNDHTSSFFYIPNAHWLTYTY